VTPGRFAARWGCGRPQGEHHTPEYHRALKADPDRLAAECKFVGLQDDGDGGRLELWLCSCGTTLAARQARGGKLG
jgi:hypothetical protein